MDYKTYRKYSSALVASEFRSFGRNKMEDRKLAFHNDGVNKNKERRRKSFVSETEQINKHFQENVSKTTPSVEQYLSRSKSKYNAWKIREQERLDRRYRGLYKSYLKEYSDLKLDESIAGLTGIRKLSTASDISDDLAAKADATDGEQQVDTGVFGAETDPSLDAVDGVENPTPTPNTEEDEELDQILAIGNMALDKKRHQTSSISDTHDHLMGDDDKRRFSTGGILFQEERKIRGLRAAKHIEKDTPDATGSESKTDHLDKSETASAVQDDKKDKQDDSNGADGMKKKTKRSSSLQKTPSTFVPMGTRLDRRSSLANINIAVKYGN